MCHQNGIISRNFGRILKSTIILDRFIRDLPLWLLDSKILPKLLEIISFCQELNFFFEKQKMI